MLVKLIGTLATIVLCSMFTPAGLCAEDWPHWRGAQRNGTTAETSGFAGGRWLDEQPAWTCDVGEGTSSPLVIGGKVYVLGWRDGRDQLVCLDAASGNELWKRTYPAPQYGRHHEGDEGFYSGPSSTPEYDPATGLLFTLSLDGDLRGWDTRKNGEPVWQKKLLDEFQVPKRPRVGRAGRRDYGCTISPFVLGETLLVEVGSPSAGTVVAFDVRTGTIRWKSQAKRLAGHSGGLVPLNVEGLPCVAALTLSHVLVMRVDQGHAGETLAEFEWITPFGNNIPTPAALADGLIVTTSAGGETKSVRLKVTRAGITELWRKDYGAPVCSPVIRNESAYWVSNKLYCVDLATGETRWTGPPRGDPGSCLLTSDDRLVVFRDKGELTLCETAERSPEEYRELATRGALFAHDAWPHVVLAGGRVLCRDRMGSLVCLRVAGVK